ncbi:MAG: hypothetical protein IJZ44_02235 [Lachnospiraceae bacterium]|nr:hypothetical protein [Lachnospiraceae bacterium]
MRTKRTQVFLKGTTGKSWLVQRDGEGNVIKQKEVGTYKAFFISDKGYRIISSGTEDKVLVEYDGDYVNGIYQVVVENDKPKFTVFTGYFCVIWYDEKGYDRMHLLWTELGKDSYQYFEFRTRGIDNVTLEEISFHTISSFIGRLPREITEKIDDRLLCNEMKNIGNAELILEG